MSFTLENLTRVFFDVKIMLEEVIKKNFGGLFIDNNRSKSDGTNLLV